MAQLSRLQLQYKREASIFTEHLAETVARWGDKQLLFEEELARMRRELADIEERSKGPFKKVSAVDS
jgi:hypothetical protein